MEFCVFWSTHKRAEALTSALRGAQNHTVCGYCDEKVTPEGERGPLPLLKVTGSLFPTMY